MALVLTGCTSASNQTWGENQRAQIAAELRVTQFPATARTIELFRKITPDMTMKDVVGFCGLPDGDIGSGLAVFKYELSDGSTVLIGTADLKRLIYVKHGNEQLISLTQK